MDLLKGYIGQFTYENESTGFYVFDLVMEDGKVVCVGNARGFGAGETVEVSGEFVAHPVYGRQLKVKEMKALEPDSPVAVERYLGSGAIKGVGESLAKRIVKLFGEDTFRIAQEEPERLAEVKGISLKKAYDIGSQIAEKRDMRDAMLFLQQYGISQHLANKIYNRYGLRLYEIMKENPYKLAEDIKGVGFKIADEIASRSGIRQDSDYRIRCGVVHTLQEASYDGHCYLPLSELKKRTSILLSQPEDAIDAAVMSLVMERKVVKKTEDEQDNIYLSTYFYSEVKCARKLLELKDEYDSYLSGESTENIKRKINSLEKAMNIELDDLQVGAVVQCVKSGVFILSGGPGTGKTTTINTIIKYFENEGLDFYLAAPTGRAAKRMSETTGYEARTIHRLLEINGGALEDDRNAVFEKGEDNPLEADVIIIDEMSMVDIHLMKALLDAVIPGTKLVLVGDVDQLSSVGPGEVLKDILTCGVFDTVRLEKVFRQDSDSHIISNAYKINHGETLDLSIKNMDFFHIEKDNPDIIYAYIDALIRDKIPKQFGIDKLDTQILTPMRKGALGVEGLNRILQERMNPASMEKTECTYGETVFRLGDKVMQIRNDYNMEWEIVGEYNVVLESGNGVFNGDMGRITSISTYLKTLKVTFDDGKQAEYTFEQLDELELAYAVTIHKSQGSEYPVVIIPVISGPRMLLSRNLLYTAVTRAQKCVILIGLGETINSMIMTDNSMHRYTSLSKRIIEFDKEEKGGLW